MSKTKAKAKKQVTVDFQVGGGGSVYLLTPLTEQAEEWVAEHIPEDAMYLGKSVAVEHRYIGDIVEGIRGDGWWCGECRLPA